MGKLISNKRYLGKTEKEIVSFACRDGRNIMVLGIQCLLTNYLSNEGVFEKKDAKDRLFGTESQLSTSSDV